MFNTIYSLFGLAKSVTDRYKLVSILEGFRDEILNQALDCIDLLVQIVDVAVTRKARSL